MKSNVLYKLSIKQEFYTTEYMLMWVEEIAKIIEPNEMLISTFSNNFMKYNAEILREEIESVVEKAEIDLYIKTKEEHFSTYVKEEDGRVIFGLDTKEENPHIERMIEDTMCKGQGVFAFKCSTMDNFLENLDSISWYCHFEGSLKGKKITHHRNRPKEEIIDIEYNAGHSHVEAGIWFGSYHCMWFGRDFYQYISKQKLQAFSNCHENVELENDVIRIMLYKNMWDYENPVNRNRQWDFRRSVGIDEVAHSLHGRKKKVTDPVLEILPKDEKGNNVTRFYFTSHGKNVRKSQASVERTYTHSPKGKLLHVEHRKINNEDAKDGMD